MKNLAANDILQIGLNRNTPVEIQ
jgi:hypothetical protein